MTALVARATLSITLLTLLVGAPTGALAQVAGVSGAPDFQFWPGVELSKRWRDRFTFFVAAAPLRFERTATRLGGLELASGGIFRVNRWLSVGGGYRWVRCYPLDGDGGVEHRWTTDAVVGSDLPGGLRWFDRNRGEYRIISGSLSQRYANRLQLQRSLRSLHGATPYAAGEFLYDTRFDSWNKQRQFAGLLVPWRQRLNLDIFYMREHDSNASPRVLHTLNIVVRLHY